MVIPFTGQRLYLDSLSQNSTDSIFLFQTREPLLDDNWSWGSLSLSVHEWSGPTKERVDQLSDMLNAHFDMMQPVSLQDIYSEWPNNKFEEWVEESHQLFKIEVVAAYQVDTMQTLVGTKVAGYTSNDLELQRRKWDEAKVMQKIASNL
jgi:hypothetical protein